MKDPKDIRCYAVERRQFTDKNELVDLVIVSPTFGVHMIEDVLITAEGVDADRTLNAKHID